MGQQPVLFEPRQLEPDGRRGQGECLGHGGGVERSLALQDIEDGAPSRGQLLQRLGSRRPGRSSARSCSRQDEVDVAELVPQVPLGQRGGVGRLEQVAPGDGLEHGEM